MEVEEKIKIALIRGDSLNQWEGGLWNELGNDFAVTGFCSEHNLYPIDGLKFSVKKLPSSADSFLARQYDKFVNARFQPLNGLEEALQDYDIAHTAEISYFFTNQVVRAKSKNLKLKVVATVWDNSFGRFEYNYWPGFGTPPAWWRKKIGSIIKENVAGVDLFLPVTDYSAEMLLDYGVTSDKIKVLTPAVMMPESGAEVEQLLDQHQLRGRQFYLAVNRMIKGKGIYDIMYAWKIYLRRHPETKSVLVMIGSGPEQDNIARLVREWGMEKSVQLIDRLPNHQVRSLYAYAKALILASLPGPVWQEQFGYVLAEAISGQCPVISTYSGAIPEVVEDAGILCTPGNPPELARAIEQYDNRQVYDTCKNNCLQVREKFAVAKFKQELEAHYRNLMA